MLASALRATLTAALRWQPSGIGQSRPRWIRRTTMSNHNLFTLTADGAAVPASSEAILIARQLPPDQTVAIIELLPSPSDAAVPIKLRAPPSPIEYADTLPGKFATYT